MTGVTQLEHLFRVVASLDVDKDDLKRYEEFVFDKLVDFLTIAAAVAKANDRDVIEFRDLPITKGLQERMHEFRRVDRDDEFSALVGRLVPHPQLDATLSDETDERLVEVAGGLSVGLAHTFTIIDPKLRNPSTSHWDRALQLFDLVL
jgi:hypothetical protein